MDTKTDKGSTAAKIITAIGIMVFLSTPLGIIITAAAVSPPQMIIIEKGSEETTVEEAVETEETETTDETADAAVMVSTIIRNPFKHLTCWNAQTAAETCGGCNERLARWARPEHPYQMFLPPAK